MIKDNTVPQQSHGSEHLVKVQRITMLEELNGLMNQNVFSFYKATKICQKSKQANTNKTVHSFLHSAPAQIETTTFCTCPLLD